MKVTKEKIEKITIECSAEEAYWLRGFIQNSPEDVLESAKDFDTRREFFEKLGKVLEQ